ncbi:MAG: GIY-YIG nuclease family protein [Gemmatimonadota bacterium]|nr:GIY-YIG nuclease family protein [Gemmatimonadota bacterium]
MGDPGYIYALINASLDGLVKVGKTTRDPQDRIKELSSATGVPTPFILAYDIYVPNCTAAEDHLHALLAGRGYRVSENREFFNAPLKEVVVAMLEVEKKQTFQSTDGRRPPPPAPRRPDARAKHPWSDIVEEAHACYYGEGDALEDKREALRLYDQAAKLGAPEAMYFLGIMYRDGQGCEADRDKALDYMKDGVRNGYEECHAEMGILYYEAGHHENARKCWTRYFQSSSFFEAGSGLEAAYGYAYLSRTMSLGLELEFKDELDHYAEEILDLSRNAIGKATAEDAEELKDQRRKIKKHLRLRWFDRMI